MGALSGEADEGLRVVWPDDPAYAAARGGLSRSAVVPRDRPAAVARATSTDQVVEAMALAEQHDLTVAVRSGGHSLAFAGLREGTLALDLRGLDEVTVDAASRRAYVGPGVTSLALAEALEGTGLAFPVGHSGEVGLGGFLLAGGNGWNQGRWGSAAESVLGADLVLADGTRLRVDDRRETREALALLGGAGPGYPAVVTGFHLRLHPAPTVRRRALTFTPDRVREAAALAGRVTAVAEADLETTTVVARDGDEVTITVSATAHGLDAHHALRLLDVVDGPEVDRATTVEDEPTTLAAMLGVRTEPDGLAQVSQQAWSRLGPADVLAAVTDAVARAPGAYSSVLVTGASVRRDVPPREDLAYLPLGSLSVAAYAGWLPENGAEDGAENDAADALDRHRAWTEETVGTLREHWTGHYVGEVDLRATPERLERCFRPGMLARVEALRARLDPGGRLAAYPGRR